MLSKRANNNPYVLIESENCSSVICPSLSSSYRLIGTGKRNCSSEIKVLKISEVVTKDNAADNYTVVE